MTKKNKWSELTLEQKNKVCAFYSQAFGWEISNSHMKQVFQIGNPGLLLGTRNGEFYCKIAPESIKVMTMLINDHIS